MPLFLKEIKFKLKWPGKKILQEEKGHISKYHNSDKSQILWKFWGKDVAGSQIAGN